MHLKWHNCTFNLLYMSIINIKCLFFFQAMFWRKVNKIEVLLLLHFSQLNYETKTRVVSNVPFSCLVRFAFRCWPCQKTQWHDHDVFCDFSTIRLFLSFLENNPKTQYKVIKHNSLDWISAEDDSKSFPNKYTYVQCVLSIQTI